MIWALLAGTAATMLAAIIWLARREGRVSAQKDAAQAGVGEATKAIEIDETVATLDDKALDQDLRGGKK